MNELQTVEFNILRAFVDICDSLSLKYYMVCGSALGAVKYKGFIPWDDDIDVALPRPDYEVFCERAQELLPENYFVQNYRTDPRCPFFYTKLRDSSTAFIENSVRKIKMNHGVFIDVFPLDGYPADEAGAAELEKTKRRLTLRLSSAFAISKNSKLKTKAFFIAEKLLGCPRRAQGYARRLDGLLSSYPTENSELWCNHGNWQGKREYAPREQYGNGTWATFEGLRVRIPLKYDDYLSQKYGDWRAELPDDRKVGHHNAFILDLNKAYKELI